MQAFRTTLPCGSLRGTRSMPLPARPVQPCTRPLAPLAAKKGGGGKGPKKSALADLFKKKGAAQGGSAGKEPATPLQYNNPDQRMFQFLLCNSYWKLTKKYLLEGVDFEQLPHALYNAPFVCLAHDKTAPGVSDPVFNYANRAGLELWEATWDELIGLPSRKSAADGPDTQQDRVLFLERVAKTGVGVGYEGWRASLKGKRFKIKDVTLFNITGLDGKKLGQAVVFDKYELEDGTLVQVTASQGATEAQTAAQAAAYIPTAEDIAAAEARVKEQADAVRALKEVDGLTNQDIKVQLAVLELKARKEAVAALQRRVDEVLAASRAAFDDEDD